MVRLAGAVVAVLLLALPSAAGASVTVNTMGWSRTAARRR
jgi:hypothetical protein